MKRRKALKSITLSTGAMISSSALLGLIQSCSQKDPLNWAPEFFSEDQAYVIRKMADMIIPRGDNVGALDMNVHIYIDQFIKDCFDEKDKEKFQKGIQIFMDRYQNKTGSVFSESREGDKEDFIRDIYAGYNERAQELHDWININKNPDAPKSGEEDEYHLVWFLITVRDITINAFFTSEKVGKEMLAYVPIPGKYKGCVDYNGTDPVWALD
jgi:hypothetical protein